MFHYRKFGNILIFGIREKKRDRLFLRCLFAAFLIHILIAFIFAPGFPKTKPFKSPLRIEASSEESVVVVFPEEKLKLPDEVISFLQEDIEKEWKQASLAILQARREVARQKIKQTPLIYDRNTL